MNRTAIDLVTPHLLRVVSLARQAESGVNVSWHVRDAVTKSLGDMRGQYNEAALVSSYVEGLAAEAERAPVSRDAYAEALRLAVATAKGIRGALPDA